MFVGAGVGAGQEEVTKRSRARRLRQRVWRMAGRLDWKNGDGRGEGVSRARRGDSGRAAAAEEDGWSKSRESREE